MLEEQKRTWNSLQLNYTIMRSVRFTPEGRYALIFSGWIDKVVIHILCMLSGKQEQYHVENPCEDRVMGCYWLNENEFCLISYLSTEANVLYQSIFRIDFNEKKLVRISKRVHNIPEFSESMDDVSMGSLFTKPIPLCVHSKRFFVFNCWRSFYLLPWDIRDEISIRRIAFSEDNLRENVLFGAPAVIGSKLHYFAMSNMIREDREDYTRIRTTVDTMICFDLSLIPQDSFEFTIHLGFPGMSKISLNTKKELVTHRPIRIVQDGHYIIVQEHRGGYAHARTKKGRSKCSVFVVNLLTKDIHETWARTGENDLLTIYNGFILIWMDRCNTRKREDKTVPTTCNSKWKSAESTRFMQEKNIIYN